MCFLDINLIHFIIFAVYFLSLSHHWLLEILLIADIQVYSSFVYLKLGIYSKIKTSFSCSLITDHESWLNLLGYDLRSLAPQLYPDNLPGGFGALGPLPGGDPAKGSLSAAMPQLMLSRSSSIQLKQATVLPAFGVTSGFLAHLSERRLGDASMLSSPPRSAMKRDPWPPGNFPATNPASVFPFRRLGAASEPPFGRGILVSRTQDGYAVVSSVPGANAIYRDVFTSVFNQSYLLPFTFLVHNAQQDAFYFVKEETWRANEDRGQLKRLGGQVNTTYHEKEAGALEAGGSGGSGKVGDLKIHGLSAVVNLRYGTTPEKEKQRLLHHAKGQAVRKAWHKEREALRNNFAGTMEWTAAEMEEIVKVGYASGYDGEYVHDVRHYPELAEDPFNVKFVKKTGTSSSLSEGSKRRRKKRGAGRGKLLSYDLLKGIREDKSHSLVGPSLEAPANHGRSCVNKRHWWLPWTHQVPLC